MDEDIAIKVTDVYKSFKLPHEKQNSVKGLFVSVFKGNRTYEKQQVLNDISFEIKKGEFFGIVGRNGSGKSTLLKLLAGIYSPDRGNIQINGKLTPFIELGVGFNPELTGRENVYLNGALLGFNRSEIDEMYDEIVAFAELDKFMDQKLKNYSSGMQVRLAFSIAIRAKSDILLLDEVLAVGDAAFQRKCNNYFIKAKKENRTVVIVTHDMQVVRQFCTRAMIISNGKADGVTLPEKAAVLYEKYNTAVKPFESTENRWGTKKVVIESIVVAKNFFEVGDDITFNLSFKSSKKENMVIGLAFVNSKGLNVAGPNSIGVGLTSTDKIRITIPKVPLVPDEYSVTFAVFNEDVSEEYDHYEGAIVFRIKSNKVHHGLVDLSPVWEKL